MTNVNMKASSKEVKINKDEFFILPFIQCDKENSLKVYSTLEDIQGVLDRTSYFSLVNTYKNEEVYEERFRQRLSYEVNIILVLQGYEYPIVPEYSQNVHKKKIFIEIKPGMVDFISSREALDMTPRTEEFIRKLKECILSAEYWRKAIDSMSQEYFEFFIKNSIQVYNKNVIYYDSEKNKEDLMEYFLCSPLFCSPLFTFYFKRFSQNTPLKTLPFYQIKAWYREDISANVKTAFSFNGEKTENGKDQKEFLLNINFLNNGIATSKTQYLFYDKSKIMGAVVFVGDIENSEDCSKLERALRTIYRSPEKEFFQKNQMTVVFTHESLENIKNAYIPGLIPDDFTFFSAKELLDEAKALRKKERSKAVLFSQKPQQSSKGQECAEKEELENFLNLCLYKYVFLVKESMEKTKGNIAWQLEKDDARTSLKEKEEHKGKDIVIIKDPFSSRDYNAYPNNRELHVMSVLNLLSRQDKINEFEKIYILEMPRKTQGNLKNCLKKVELMRKEYSADFDVIFCKNGDNKSIPALLKICEKQNIQTFFIDDKKDRYADSKVTGIEKENLSAQEFINCLAYASFLKCTELRFILLYDKENTWETLKDLIKNIILKDFNISEEENDQKEVFKQMKGKFFSVNEIMTLFAKFVTCRENPEFCDLEFLRKCFFVFNSSIELFVDMYKLTTSHKSSLIKTQEISKEEVELLAQFVQKNLERGLKNIVPQIFEQKKAEKTLPVHSN